MLSVGALVVHGEDELAQTLAGALAEDQMWVRRNSKTKLLEYRRQKKMPISSGWKRATKKQSKFWPKSKKG